MSCFRDIWRAYPNPCPDNRRCVCKRLFRNVLYAVGHGEYSIQFDDGVTLECFCNCLHMEGTCASIHPDAIPLQVDICYYQLPPHAQEEFKSKIITLNPLKIHMKKKSIFLHLNLGFQFLVGEEAVLEGSGELNPLKANV